MLQDVEFTSATVTGYAERKGIDVVKKIVTEIKKMEIAGLKSGNATVNMQLTTADGWIEKNQK